MAIYSFITNKDIDVSLKTEFYNHAVTGATHIVKKAEGAAVSLMKSMLNNRYDLSLVFPSIKEWSSATDYKEGEYSSKEDIIYTAKTDNTNKTPADNTNEWSDDDPRDMLLVLHCVNITVFYILERVNPRKIPEDVVEAYNRAVNWLEDVKRGNENPDLPLKTENSLEVRGGSNEPIDHYY